MSGSVGIGTSSPSQKLHIVGNTGLPATSSTSQNGTLRLQLAGYGTVLDFGGEGPTTGKQWIQVTDASNLALTYPLLLNPNGGNVGIGTTSPTEKLDVNGSIKSSSGIYGNFFEGEFGQVLASTSYAGATISKNLAELDPGAYLIHAYMMRGGDGVNTTYSVLWYYMHLSGFGGGSDYITALYSNPGPQNNNGRIALTGAGYTVEITWGGARGPAAVTALKLRDGY
jgi:hypothetical protein